MSKEELKHILDSLTIEKIESFEIKYKREKDYGMYSDRSETKTKTITYNK